MTLTKSKLVSRVIENVYFKKEKRQIQRTLFPQFDYETMTKKRATEILDARISGSGDVFYKGYPRIISKISGSGSLESRN